MALGGSPRNLACKIVKFPYTNNSIILMQALELANRHRFEIWRLFESPLETL